jgi:hypothetical protein
MCRRGKWQLAHRAEHRYSAEKIAIEMYDALKRGDAEYEFPQE